MLPYTAALVALPPEGEIEAMLEAASSEAIRLSRPLAVAPGEEGPSQGEGSYAPLRLEEIAVMRGVRLGRVVCAPFSVEGEVLRVVPQATLTLRWAQNGAASQWRGEAFSPIARAVLNPEHLMAREMRPRLMASTSPSVEVLMRILEAGVYRLTYADLAPFGFGNALWNRLHLWQGSDEVALDVEGDDDEWFEEGEAFYFYVEPRPSRWEEGDTLRLTSEERPAVRMDVRSALPEGSVGNIWVTRTLESNLEYAPDRLTPNLPFGRDGDRWFWRHFQRPGTGDEESAMLPFTVSGVNPSQAASLTLWLVGQTSLAANPDHLVDVHLNNAFLGRVAWDGRVAITETLAIPPGLLQEGDNFLHLGLSGLPDVPFDALWLDAFAVRYDHSGVAMGRWMFEGEPTPHQYEVTLGNVQGLRAYDITSPLAPQRLEGWQAAGTRIRLGDPPGQGGRRYWVGNAAGFLSPARLWVPHDVWAYEDGKAPIGADLLIITRPEFADAAAELKARYAPQGIGGVVANVEGIYDHWGEGRINPQAIVQFVRSAYETWQPRPRYLLLIGDGSFDPRRYRDDSPPTFIPPYLVDVPPRALETAADNRYACVDGEDTLPDLAVGRLPVRTASEAAAYVAKLDAYGGASHEGGWRRRASFVADDPDTGGDFLAFSEESVARFLTEGWEVQSFYCQGVDPTMSDCAPAQAAQLHQDLEAHWQQGMGLVEYTGHSSWHQWAVERLLHLDHVPHLTAGSRWPIVASWTCFTSAFHRPGWVLDERLVVEPQAGAIATWGPASLGTEPAHRTLVDGFHDALLGDQVSTLGEAVDAAKLALFIKGPEFDLLDTYILLGDPALRLAFLLSTGDNRYYLPLIRR